MATVCRQAVRKLLNHSQVLCGSRRCLNIQEFQSKDLLSQHGMNVQKFRIVANVDEARTLKDNFSAAEYVIKAQILAGGRGKGTFDNGFKGGVQLTKDSGQIPVLVEKMVGHRLITKQTPKEGIPVLKVMVAESVDIDKETYVCLLLDREHNGPVLIASPEGGGDIEEIAEKMPERIKTIPIDINTGITSALAYDVAQFLEFKGPQIKLAADQIERMWDLFLGIDATQVEINPLVQTPQGNIVCIDAKINFDDNAEFRQSHIFEQEDTTEKDPREVDASKYSLNYIGMTGNIGCLVNGAGLAMATMDIIKLYGGDPANFLDVGGNVKEDQVFHAFRILTSDKNVKAILVNVFGGIVNCATIANGIVNASRSINLRVPLVVRLEGTNVDEAKSILKTSGLPIESAADLDEAAEKAVASLKSS